MMIKNLTNVKQHRTNSILLNCRIWRFGKVTHKNLYLKNINAPLCKLLLMKIQNILTISKIYLDHLKKIINAPLNMQTSTPLCTYM